MLQLRNAKMLGKKVTLMATAFILAVSSLTAVVPFMAAQQASATAGVVNIHNIADLHNAIENQADGQTWNIYSVAGGYGLTPISDITAGCPTSCQTGWYMPITASDLTISGIGNPTLYGSTNSPNGSWASQDLVAVFGDNVTIKNLTLTPKTEANKTVEVMGDNSTIQNVTIKQNSTDPWGGSIYYNDPTGTNQTVQTLNNVTVNNGGVSVHAANATINTTDVDLVYKTNVDWINQYRFRKADSSTVVNGTPSYTYQVSNALNNINSALTATSYAGTIAGNEKIQLVSDLFASSQITINKPNLTIDGKKAAGGYYTIFGTFDKTSNSNNSVLSVQADGVRINELNVDGQNHQLHGINTYDAQDLQTWRVTVKNNGFSGLNVNRSWVQGVDLTTEHNGWNGVDVDKPGAFFQGAGINHHNETIYITKNGKTKPAPALYVDDVTVGTVNDTNGQYVTVDNYWGAGDRAYFLKSDVQPVKNLSIKYQNDSTSLADSATVNKAVKPGNNKLVLNFDVPASPAAVDHYITTETHPDGTTATQWNGYHNTWLTINGFSFGAHGNGQYTYTVTTYYKNGTSATSDTISLWFDNQSPITAFVVAPENNSFVNGNFQVSATASDTARLKSVGFDVRDPNAAAGTNAWRAGCVAGTMVLNYTNNDHDATLSCTINTSGLVEGQLYYVRVHAGDYAGYGSSVANSVRNFTIDRTKPVVDVALSTSTVVQTGVTPNLTVNASDALSGVDYVQYRIQNADGSNISGYGWVTVANGSTVNLSEIDNLGTGSYRVNVRAFDKAGNKRNSLNAFVVDRSVTSTLNVSSDSTATPTISGTATHTLDGTPVANVDLDIHVDGATYKATTNATGYWSISPTVAAGDHDVTVAYAGADPLVAPLATDSFTTAFALAEGDSTTGGNTNQNQNQNQSNRGLTTPSITGVRSVLGDATNTPATTNTGDDTTGTPGVEGTSTEKTLAAAVNNTDGKALGLAWYWWLLIVAAFAALVWWIVAGIRHRQAEN